MQCKLSFVGECFVIFKSVSFGLSLQQEPRLLAVEVRRMNGGPGVMASKKKAVSRTL